ESSESHSCQWRLGADWDRAFGLVRTSRHPDCAAGPRNGKQRGAGFLESTECGVTPGCIRLRCGDPPSRRERGGTLDRGKEKGYPRQSHTRNQEPGFGVSAVRGEA